MTKALHQDEVNRF